LLYQTIRIIRIINFKVCLKKKILNKTISFDENGDYMKTELPDFIKKKVLAEERMAKGFACRRLYS
jgi:hypothetical protein